MKYNQICSKINNKELTRGWENTQKVPYAFSATKWIGYDDVQSVKIKADYIKKKGLGGAMFWNVDDDDYDNKCAEGKFPLITAAFKMLNDVKIPVSKSLI